MESLIYSFSYFGIFVISFLASTLLPVGSEGFVILMVVMKYKLLFILIFATFGNFFGALTNYYIGKLGNRFFLHKYIKIEKKTEAKARLLYKKYGPAILFFSWLPIIGDPICVIPGIFSLNLRIFMFWVFIGKLFRYSLLIYITKSVIS